MFDEQINQKQMQAWAAAAVIAPLANASGCGWLTLLLVSAVVIPLGAAGCSGWQNMNRWVCVAEFIWIALVLVHLMKDCALYWPTENRIAIPIILLVLSALGYNSVKGTKVGAVLLWSMILLFIPVLLCGFSDIHIKWLKPQWGASAWRLVPILLLPMLSAMFSSRECRKPLGLCVGTELFGLAMTVITQGLLGMQICLKETAPLYTLAQTLHMGGLSRFEAVVSTTVTLGYYAMASFLICCGTKIADRIGMEDRTAAVVLIGGAVACLLLGISIDDAAVGGGSVLFWIILPICCRKRKSKRVEKSA